MRPQKNVRDFPATPSFYPATPWFLPGALRLIPEVFLGLPGRPQKNIKDFPATPPLSKNNIFPGPLKKIDFSMGPENNT